MTGKVKHIPENSICLIIKLQTMEEKSNLIQDEEFQKCKAQLESNVLRKGASYESFTN
ncbi:hypothetical protein LCGC14_1756730 [marine sediment metagenome]|uniref:Uncharacterized protein n=1 Tax=marine sediment metagenome TaxID=412755 RepID=A0A0F9K1V3_9ZZZZ